MGRKAGTLLWNRVRIPTIDGTGNGGPPGVVDIDTGLTQVNKSFADMSLDEPTFEDPTRIQVIPMAPTSVWTTVTHGEPFFDLTTETIHVVFTNVGAVQVNNLNVMFWDPHSMVGPGTADTYT